MARINIDEQFWIDVAEVAAVIGDYDKSVGIAVKWFKYAQEKHKHGKFVSEEDFKTRFHEALIPLFAQRVDGGIQCTGAEKHFGWLTQKREAGRKGGLQKPESKTKHLKQNRSEPKRTEAKPSEPKRNLAKPSDTEASISISSSFSSSDSPSSLVEDAENLKILSRRVWEAYSNSYFDRYKTDPVRNAKVNTQVKELAKRLGAEAPDVVSFYLTHNKTFYVGKCHDLGACVADAEALRTQWAKGKALTNNDLRRFEKSLESNDLDRMISEGKI